jgi:hydrogenase maturation factor
MSIFEINDIRLAFTTDSFVVDPLFFPGGDIGEISKEFEQIGIYKDYLVE